MKAVHLSFRWLCLSLLSFAMLQGIFLGCGSSSGIATVPFTVGGTVAGLSGTVVLQNNAGDDHTLAADGSFTFATALANGAAYVVTVLTQPSGQTCTLANASGTISGNNITNVTVTCAATTFTVGGTVSGLFGTTQVVLANNGGDNLTVPTNGSFTFATALADLAAYAVTVVTGPDSGQACDITAGSGTVAGANVSSVTVACRHKIIFVSTATHDGAFEGAVAGSAITNADALCQAETTLCPSLGTCKAMIADGVLRKACTDANCVGAAPQDLDWVLAADTTYTRSDGTTVVGTTTDNAIFTFSVDAGITISESTPWTGLNTDWTSVALTNNCQSWTTSDPASFGNFGLSDMIDSTLITQPAISPLDTCDSTNPLYCVEQ